MIEALNHDIDELRSGVEEKANQVNSVVMQLLLLLLLLLLLVVVVVVAIVVVVAVAGCCCCCNVSVTTATIFLRSCV